MANSSTEDYYLSEFEQGNGGWVDWESSLATLDGRETQGDGANERQVRRGEGNAVSRKDHEAVWGEDQIFDNMKWCLLTNQCCDGTIYPNPEEIHHSLEKLFFFLLKICILFCFFHLLFELLEFLQLLGFLNFHLILFCKCSFSPLDPCAVGQLLGWVTARVPPP